MNSDKKEYKCQMLVDNREKMCQEECGFIGNYIEMKRHLKLEHGQGSSNYFEEFTTVID